MAWGVALNKEEDSSKGVQYEQNCNQRIQEVEALFLRAHEPDDEDDDGELGNTKCENSKGLRQARVEQDISNLIRCQVINMTPKAGMNNNRGQGSSDDVDNHREKKNPVVPLWQSNNEDLGVQPQDIEDRGDSRDSPGDCSNGHASVFVRR